MKNLMLLLATVISLASCNSGQKSDIQIGDNSKGNNVKVTQHKNGGDQQGQESNINVGDSSANNQIGVTQTDDTSGNSPQSSSIALGKGDTGNVITVTQDGGVSNPVPSSPKDKESSPFIDFVTNANNMVGLVVGTITLISLAGGYFFVKKRNNKKRK